MSFALTLMWFILGAALIALCLFAIPGRGGSQAGGHDAGHGHHDTGH